MKLLEVDKSESSDDFSEEVGKKKRGRKRVVKQKDKEIKMEYRDQLPSDMKSLEKNLNQVNDKIKELEIEFFENEDSD